MGYVLLAVAAYLGWKWYTGQAEPTTPDAPTDISLPDSPDGGGGGGGSGGFFPEPPPVTPDGQTTVKAVRNPAGVITPPARTKPTARAPKGVKLARPVAKPAKRPGQKV